ncbi:MAG: hypothetical protein NZ519_05205 [Bacteroidia bacterium]|nr:hypothetical protein [Bacteroidia bacterium]MDW8301128.1 hypothetical protein [Bacteroidia bacterium]
MLIWGCQSKQERYKKIVTTYYDTYYQKRDIEQIKKLFTTAGIQYTDDNYSMPADTFALIFEFDKQIKSKAYILDMKINKDTVIVFEKITDVLDSLLKRPAQQYRKKFVIKEDKILKIISSAANTQEWTDKYIQNTQKFFVWVQQNHPKESLKIILEPYSNSELLLSIAKEYAKQLK